MKIKLALLTSVLGLAFLSVPIAQAQSAGAAKLQALSSQLNLTPKQKVELLPVLEAEAPKLQAIKSNASMPPAQKLQSIRAIHAETDPKVKAILTPAQYTKWQSIRQQEVKQAIANKRAAKSS